MTTMRHLFMTLALLCLTSLASAQENCTNYRAINTVNVADSNDYVTTIKTTKCTTTNPSVWITAGNQCNAGFGVDGSWAKTLWNCNPVGCCPQPISDPFDVSMCQEVAGICQQPCPDDDPSAYVINVPSTTYMSVGYVPGGEAASRYRTIYNPSSYGLIQSHIDGIGGPLCQTISGLDCELWQNDQSMEMDLTHYCRLTKDGNTTSDYDSFWTQPEFWICVQYVAHDCEFPQGQEPSSFTISWEVDYQMAFSTQGDPCGGLTKDDFTPVITKMGSKVIQLNATGTALKDNTYDPCGASVVHEVFDKQWLRSELLENKNDACNFQMHANITITPDTPGSRANGYFIIETTMVGEPCPSSENKGGWDCGQ